MRKINELIVTITWLIEGTFLIWLGITLFSWDGKVSQKLDDSLIWVIIPLFGIGVLKLIQFLVGILGVEGTYE